jgi:hypothetical protein
MNSRGTNNEVRSISIQKYCDSIRKEVRLRRILWASILMSLVLLAPPGDSFAQSALTDDADVNCLLPLPGCGSGLGLSLAPDANVYVKFKLASTLPVGTPGAQVARATIKLYVNDVGVAGTIDIYQAGGPWKEQTITAGNAPPLGVLIAEAVPVQSDMKGKFLVIDVTSAVQEWLGTDGSGSGGTANYGVVLVARNGAKATFDSKENLLTSHEPGLNVQLKSGGGVTSISADGPLTVTNPTTTPNISLGVVPTTNGGTGLSSSGSSGNILRSDGSAWTSMPLGATDIPAGSANYIQNSNSPQAAANFNVAGTGTANILNAATQFNIGGNRVLSVAGNFNIFTGIHAGSSNTTGIGNSFFGIHAGQNNTEGSFNSFVGTNAGVFNTTGISNSFFGNSTGANNLTGQNNSFFGGSTGLGNTSGNDNSFFGSNAGGSNTTGANNSFFGRSAGISNLTGNGNSFFGWSTGANSTLGDGNSFFGFLAGSSNTTGANNSFVGRESGKSNTTGSNLTIIGVNANVGANNLNFATAIGAGAIVSSSNTIVLGRGADTVQVPGTLSIPGAFSANSLNAATQFNLNGNRALAAPGTNNLVGGSGAGANLTTGQNNTFFGPNAGQAVTAANGNSFFGRDTGRVNTSGVNNSFLGDRAGANNTTGNFNSFYGEQSGVNNSTGSSNSFYGRVAGINNTTGANNTFIGTGAGNPSVSTQVNNSTAIGAGAIVSTSNTIMLGTSAQTTLLSGGIASTFNLGVSAPSGIIANNLIFRNANISPSPAHVCMRSFSIGTDGGWAFTSCTSEFSSANNKTDVLPFSEGLDVINRLKPVAFAWKEDGRRGVGLNAEDVAEVAPQLVTRNQKGEIEDLKEGSLNVLFINAIKEQQKRIEVQQQQIGALKKLLCQSNPEADICKNK